MEIPLRRSKCMDKDSVWFGSLERTFVRIPQEFRDKCEFIVGDYISFITQKGDLISMQVEIAKKEDVETDPLCGYLTSEMCDLIGIEKKDKSICEVNLVTGITLRCDPEFFLVRR